MGVRREDRRCAQRLDARARATPRRRCDAILRRVRRAARPDAAGGTAVRRAGYAVARRRSSSHAPASARTRYARAGRPWRRADRGGAHQRARRRARQAGAATIANPYDQRPGAMARGRAALHVLQLRRLPRRSGRRRHRSAAGRRRLDLRRIGREHLRHHRAGAAQRHAGVRRPASRARQVWKLAAYVRSLGLSSARDVAATKGRVRSGIPAGPRGAERIADLFQAHDGSWGVVFVIFCGALVWGADSTVPRRGPPAMTPEDDRRRTPMIAASSAACSPR